MSYWLVFDWDRVGSFACLQKIGSVFGEETIKIQFQKVIVGI
jgi:hypothetical protein